MTLFRSVVVGLLGALVLLHLGHLHEHSHMDEKGEGNERGAERQSPTVVVTQPRSVVREVRMPPPRPPSPRSQRAWVTEDTVLVDIERVTIRELNSRSHRGSRPKLIPSEHPRGVELHAIPGRSLMAALGLRNGDVLVTVAGRPAPPTSGALANLVAQGRDFVEINLLRAGKPVRMIVLIHGA